MQRSCHSAAPESAPGELDSENVRQRTGTNYRPARHGLANAEMGLAWQGMTRAAAESSFAQRGQRLRHPFPGNRLGGLQLLCKQRYA